MYVLRGGVAKSEKLKQETKSFLGLHRNVLIGIEKDENFRAPKSLSNE